LVLNLEPSLPASDLPAAELAVSAPLVPASAAVLVLSAAPPNPPLKPSFTDLKKPFIPPPPSGENAFLIPSFNPDHLLIQIILP